MNNSYSFSRFNKFTFEEWHSYYKNHIDNLFNIFVNNLEEIDKNSIRNEDKLREDFTKFIYKHSTKYKSPYDSLMEEDCAENNNYKYSRLE